MSFDAKGAIRLIEQAQYVATQLESAPHMRAIVQEILGPAVNGHSEAPARGLPTPQKRRLSAATRAKMRAAAKKRWAQKTSK